MSAIDTRQRKYVVRRAALIVKQDGKCPCGGDLLGEVFIDHDHKCCPVDRADRACGQCDRSAIHPGCNRALGAVRDNPLIMLKLAHYLAKAA